MQPLISSSSFAWPPFPSVPGSPSSLGASAPLIAATIALAFADHIVGVTGAIVITGTDTTAVVGDLSVCSRRSSAQCLFDSLELDELSVPPDLRLHGSSCSQGSCPDSGSTGEFVVPLSGSRGAQESTRYPASSYHHQTAVSPNFKKSESDSNHWAGNFPALALQPPLSHGLTGWFRRGAEGTKAHNNP